MQYKTSIMAAPLQLWSLVHVQINVQQHHAEAVTVMQAQKIPSARGIVQDDARLLGILPSRLLSGCPALAQ